MPDSYNFTEYFAVQVSKQRNREKQPKTSCFSMASTIGHADCVIPFLHFPQACQSPFYCLRKGGKLSQFEHPQGIEHGAKPVHLVQIWGF